MIDQKKPKRPSLKKLKKTPATWYDNVSDVLRLTYPTDLIYEANGERGLFEDENSGSGFAPGVLSLCHIFEITDRFEFLGYL